MKVAILGSTGYAGMVLLRLLARHPDVSELYPASSSRAGEPVRSVDAGIGEAALAACACTDGRLVSVADAAAARPDVVFSALPHLASAAACEPFFGTSVVIDLSADLRIEDPALFQRAYKEAPPRPDLLGRAVYGLCERYASAVRTADVIANPGCYPTATLLPLLPLLEAGLISGRIVVNALSGISGAGKKVAERFLYVERTESTCAYAPGTTHRHTPEIQKELDKMNTGAELFFTPHLVPLKRGMAVTTVAPLAEGATPEAAATALHDAYDASPFVQLTGNAVPETRDVWGSNRCDIGWQQHGPFLYLFSVIDNLMKGASGQAVQNMNLRFGLEETAGLPVHGEV